MKPLRAKLYYWMGKARDISEHLGLIHGLACDPDVKRIVEFGFRGPAVSSVALCASGKDVYSYDPDNKCIPHVREFRKIAPNFHFKHMSSLDEAIECDLLLIDSLHKHAHLTKELEMHADSVTKWIALHDTVTFPELMKATQEFLDRRPEWQIHLHLQNNNGFTLLRRHTTQ